MEMLCTGYIDFSLPYRTLRGRGRRNSRGRILTFSTHPTDYMSRSLTLPTGVPLLWNLPVEVYGMVAALSLEWYLPLGVEQSSLGQWYSTFLVRVPPEIISIQLCTPKAFGV
jgi:hypothetical protein